LPGTISLGLPSGGQFKGSSEGKGRDIEFFCGKQYPKLTWKDMMFRALFVTPIISLFYLV
jgi:hypothetical protein